MMINYKLIYKQLKLTILLTLFFSLSLLSIRLYAEDKVEQKIVPYQIMHAKDFYSMTGCDRSTYDIIQLQVALNFLVFSEYHDGNENEFRFARDLEYTHRHSRELFTESIKDEKCKHPSLMRMGKELLILNLDGHREDILVDKNTKRLQLNNLEDYYVENKSDKPVFEVLSRVDYMELTTCLVSPATYHKYHMALFLNTGYMFPKQAPKHMREFLNEVGAGSHNADGTEIAKKCLHNAIKILAKDLGLLNKSGSYVLQ